MRKNLDMQDCWQGRTCWQWIINAFRGRTWESRFYLDLAERGKKKQAEMELMIPELLLTRWPANGRAANEKAPTGIFTVHTLHADIDSLLAGCKTVRRKQEGNGWCSRLAEELQVLSKTITPLAKWRLKRALEAQVRTWTRLAEVIEHATKGERMLLSWQN